MQSQARCAPNPHNEASTSVAPPGATGFVGSRLVSRLASQGSTVHVLTRNVQRAKFVLPYPNVQFFDARDWAAGIEGASGVVNLAGEPISTRWTPQIKQEIKASRIRTTQQLVNILNSMDKAQRPSVFVSSSAVGAVVVFCGMHGTHCWILLVWCRYYTLPCVCYY